MGALVLSLDRLTPFILPQPNLALDRSHYQNRFASPVYLCCLLFNGGRSRKLSTTILSAPVVSCRDRTRQNALRARASQNRPYTKSMNEYRFARSDGKRATTILIRPDTSRHVRTYPIQFSSKTVPYPKPMNATSFVVRSARVPPDPTHTGQVTGNGKRLGDSKR
jgi:hypothetical protein